ncbi:hypothetical protein JCM11251_001734 [Rhodosporidiobolus azoricus]
MPALGEDIELSTTATEGRSAPRRGSFSSMGTVDSKYDEGKDSRPASLAGLPELAKHQEQLATQAGLNVGPDEAQRRRMRRMSMTEGEEDGAELPPIDGGKGAWTFVAVGFILECVSACVWGWSYSFPSVLVYMQEHDPWQQYSLASLSAIGSVLIALEFFLPLVVIMFFKRYPEWRRTALAVSGLVNCAGMLGSAWATKPSQVVILQGVLGGVTGAVLYAPVLAFLNDWFLEKRGLASGLVFAGTSIGGTVLPYLIEYLLQKYGWKTLCQVWAGMSLLVYSAAVFALKPRVPARKPGPGMTRTPWLNIPLKALVDPVAVVMFLTTFIFSLPYYSVSFYLPTYTLNLGSSFSATVVVSIFNLAASIGSPLTGWASDKSLPWTVFVMSIVSGIVALTAWGYATTLGAVFAFAVLFAMPSAIYSCWGVATKDAAGLNPHLSTFFVCLFACARGIASLVGPFVGSSLYDPKAAKEEPSWGRFGFSRVIIFAGIVSILSSFGGVALWYARVIKEKRRRLASMEARRTSVAATMR